ncbi:MAG: dehypoxanthine futalosine cyclase [Nitrospinae bacterium RIFCSPLOWO2_02_39_17]|nr:MAG: dehypoxanthine futalosine cyclase [Nitrospinae bacterium RIFCSPHIGHO2_02_39_11]OGV98777.1 MAG: dehypoxanthine futalosine cyclase [Nitrospinae bacterium RIFCSPHIGHO2_12_FULL_39_42]OGW00591.1 MAG: dehypoxanthine futalosine cyclase [Nitrospinae bacterium RIFCSPHIGHO2_02_FULL_39_82]OGW06492.1 MAG: dehypoxanthine futalosine cyclase [Nitrospinae bacterium RIFCSPLOWO2_02_39_17]OGW09151.1 MAG: dehypoxanthine futalosine cyclase [Nitrospinae bacterium RIFCSPLOWO2_12_39_15]OGW09329.1 MAG: dehypox
MNIFGKVLNGERLSAEDGERLFESKDIISLGRAAQKISKRKHPDGIVTYIVDRNINYTNICISKCLFCAFYREKDSKDAYVLNREELSKKIEETIKLGGVQILLQGGLNADFEIDFYEELLLFIKSFNIHIHGFSPPEIVHISKMSKLSVEDVIKRLKNAGLSSIPGGGAEILVNKIRKKISPNKCTAQEWLNVMETAHNLGLRTTATMMYGHIESHRDRIEHLIKIRELQDKTRGFTAFIPWSFQSKNTKLQTLNSELQTLNSFGVDYLKTLSISRLMLDNFDNIQASWVTQGAKVAQLALFFGANDMGSTMIEENVVKAAGVSFRMSEGEIRRLIEDAGFKPAKRDTFYQPI